MLLTRDPPAPRATAEWRRCFSRRDGADVAQMRVLVVFAHPDDEAIGLGAVLPFLSDVWLVCVTDGAPRDLSDAHRAGCLTRETYALRRQAELESALRRWGLQRRRFGGLNVVEQEASFRLRDIVAVLSERLDTIKPDVVVTLPYEGGHPDHDSTAFAVHMACRARRAEGRRAPLILEMTSYHGGGGGLHFGKFLGEGPEDEMEIVLDEQAQAAKRALLDCYASQADALAHVPLSHERFRVAPHYNFAEPPHPGELFYEQFASGMDGVNWRRHAWAALLGGLPAPLAPTTRATGRA